MAAYHNAIRVAEWFARNCHELINKPETETGNTTLHIASELRHGDMIALLVEAGADRSIKNKQRQTPLDLARAVQRRRAEGIELSRLIAGAHQGRYSLETRRSACLRRIGARRCRVRER